MSAARTIILAVCEEYGVTPVELRSTTAVKTRAAFVARGAAISRLRQAAFSLRWIARYLGINVSTVKYHLYPKAREKSSRGYLMRELRAAHREQVRA